jgi:hypothetical protein
LADRIRSTFLEHAGGRFGILNSLSLSGSLSLASAKRVPSSERRKILPFTLARAKYAPLSIVASVAQLAEQLTLNFSNVYNGFVTICFFFSFRDFVVQSPVTAFSLRAVS